MEPSGRQAFPSTHLSLVELAATPGAPGWEAAWERFFRGYWPPLYGYLRRTGSTHADALDLLQDCFLLGASGALLARYDASRGRFRTYLLTCLTNLRRKDRRRERARPDGRPDGRAPEWLADAPPEPVAGDPEERFELEWNRCVQERAIEQVRERLRREPDELALRVLDAWVLRPGRPPAAELAAELGLTPNALYTRATRLRRDLVTEVERCLRQLASAPQELAAERDAVLRQLRGER
ncbi:MAG: RNA polymerase sigma factor [Planctomycetota bacterium]